MISKWFTCFLLVFWELHQITHNRLKDFFVACLAHIKRTLNHITAKGEFDYYPRKLLNPELSHRIKVAPLK